MKKYLLMLLLVAPLLGQEQDKAILIGLTATDVITTSYILRTGGFEMNPLVEPIADNMVLYSAVKVMVVAAYLNSNPSKNNIRIVNFITALVVGNNFYQIITKEQACK